MRTERRPGGSVPAGGTNHRAFSVFLLDWTDLLEMRNWLHSPAVRLFSTAAVWSTLAYPAVVLDRIAVVVGKHVIKTSDIDRDLRVTEFINQQGIDFGTTAKHQSAERLIDQELIREEIITGSYRRPPESEAE